MGKYKLTIGNFISLNLLLAFVALPLLAPVTQVHYLGLVANVQKQPTEIPLILAWDRHLTITETHKLLQPTGYWYNFTHILHHSDEQDVIDALKEVVDDETNPYGQVVGELALYKLGIDADEHWKKFLFYVETRGLPEEYQYLFDSDFIAVGLTDDESRHFRDAVTCDSAVRVLLRNYVMPQTDPDVADDFIKLVDVENERIRYEIVRKLVQYSDDEGVREILTRLKSEDPDEDIRDIAEYGLTNGPSDIPVYYDEYTKYAERNRLGFYVWTILMICSIYISVIVYRKQPKK